MNLIHAKLTTRTGKGRSRNGLTIIEVLTSIVVAMIGVFGVMILIPFAVKQAKTGLDSDASVALAQNAYSLFEIEGFRNPNNWMTAPTTAYDPFGRSDDPEIFSIDPLGIAENGNNYGAARFPFNQSPAGSTPFPNALFIDAVNLRIPAAMPMAMGPELARRMFRSADDLVFGEAADELDGPEQIFDQSGTGGFLRRQSIGRLSWSAIVVPFKTDPFLPSTRWSYRMYILVYKDRVTFIDPVVANRDRDDQMITALVTNTGTHSPVSNVFLDAGPTVQGVVNRDDWVMLINQNAAAQVGFQHQIAFYRVVNSSDANGSNPTSSLTLDGPDFTFGDGSGTLGPTHVVHLKNVVGVYERTFEPEFRSNWSN